MQTTSTRNDPSVLGTPPMSIFYRVTHDWYFMVREGDEDFMVGPFETLIESMEFADTNKEDYPDTETFYFARCKYDGDDFSVVDEDTVFKRNRDELELSIRYLSGDDHD